MGKNQHVTKHEKGWQVISDNAKRATVVTTTKQEAYTIAREIARNQKSELLVHNQDGKISEKHSYGNDPYPPKG